MSFYNIVILAGGTGGHISPGVAIAESFMKRATKTNPIRVTLLSSTRNTGNPDLVHLETLANSLKEDYVEVGVRYWDPPPMPRRPWQLFSFVRRIFRYLRNLKKLHSEMPISAVIGMGGYTTFPALWWAGRNSVPVFLCEQNCVPGKVTRIFAGKAEKIFISYPLSKKAESLYQKTQIEEIGNPLRQRILKVKPKTTRKGKGLHVLAMGGSQGAKQINNIMENIVASGQVGAGKTVKKLTLIAGSKTYPEYQDLASNDVEVLAYDPAIEKRMQQADVIVARSGAGVLAEATYFGLPMLLIPYPYAADNHQKDNAAYAASQGGAFVFEQDAAADTILSRLNELNEPDIYKRVVHDSQILSRPKAGDQIADDILKFIGDTKQ